MEKIHLLITRCGPVWRVRILMPWGSPDTLAGIPRRGVPDTRGRSPAVHGGVIPPERR